MQTDEKKKPADAKKRRRKKGVPFSLVLMLTVLALICGGVMGYVGGAKFSSTAKQLREAQEAIDGYELTLMELYADEFDAAALDTPVPGDEDGNAALTGAQTVPEETAEPVIVAEFNGGAIMSDEARAEYEATLSNYVMTGTDVSSNTDALKQTVLEQMVSDRLAYQKAVELGFTTLTSEDEDRISELAKAEYAEKAAFYLDMVREDDMTDEENMTAAQEYLAQTEGYTLDSVITNIESNYWYTKLYNSVTSGVSVDPQQITAAYNDQVADQQERFDADNSVFEEALLSGETILYFPAGYRMVKQILFELDDASAARASEIENLLSDNPEAENAADLQAELDTLYASAEEEARDVYDQLKNGGDFDQLMDEYGDDNSMREGIFASSGYYVSANSTVWADGFVSAAMALAAPGDYCEPVRAEGGVHIIRYIANVQQGAVPLSSVTTELTADTLDSARFEAYQEQLQAWVSEADAKYYLDNFVVD